jgi:phage protein D
MAVSSGVGPHFAFIAVNGTNYPVTDGHVCQQKKKTTSDFHVTVPMSYPGALEALIGLQKSTPVSILVSTRGEQATLLTGTALKIMPSFIKRTISVSGQDQSSALHQMKVSQKFQNMTGSQIVQQLAAQAGLSVQADSSALMAGKIVNTDYARLADNVSIAQVIHKLAEFDGARWFVQNGTLFYQLQDNPQGTYTLNYVPPTPGNPMQSDCLELNFTINVLALGGGMVTVKSWHPRQAQAFQGQATFGNGGGNTNYTFHVPNLMQDHAQQHAQSKANEIGMNAVTVYARVVGDPTINVAMDLQVNGTGTSLDSTYSFDSITHEFGMGGHTMHLGARTKVSGGN